MSLLRDQVIFSMESYRSFLETDNKGWNVLEVGIDGDEKPGGNFKVFGKGNNYKTLDYLERLNPDYIADICDTKLKPEFDLIILSQTIEHIKTPVKAVRECYRILKPGGYLILDCPFNYVYHGIPEYDDYHRYTHKGLKLLLETVGFKVIFHNLYADILSSALSQKGLS